MKKAVPLMRIPKSQKKKLEAGEVIFTQDVKKGWLYTLQKIKGKYYLKVFKGREYEVKEIEYAHIKVWEK